MSDGPPVNRHKPSVDVLFRSVAKCAGQQRARRDHDRHGRRRRRGLLEMKEAGAQTIAQNEETCVVYGMPNSAMKLGAVDQEVGLPSIANVIMRFARQR